MKKEFLIRTLLTSGIRQDDKIYTYQRRSPARAL